MRIVIIMLMVCMLLAGVLPASAQSQPGEGVPLVMAPEIYNRALDALNNGSYEQAILDYSLFILLNPTSNRAYYLRGVSYSEAGRIENALADLNQSLVYSQDEIPEFTALVYATRAQIHLRQNDAEAGLADLDAAITTLPDDPANYLTRAQVYFVLDRTDEALADYNTFITMVPNSAQGFAERADLHFRLGLLDEALADYNRVVELAPGFADAYLSRAQIYIRRNNAAAALENMDEAFRLRPPTSDTASLYLQRGLLHNFLDHPTSGASDYARWIDLMSSRTIQLERDLLAPGRPLNIYLGDGVVYRVPVTGSQGQVISFEANATPGQQVDPLLVLLDPSGRAVISNDDWGSSADSIILDYRLPVSGLYTLLVSHAGGGANGSVAVFMEPGG